jgi:hypothetical protein
MFKASKIWALVGLPLVVAAVIVISLNADPTDPNPKGTLAAIFAVIGGFCVVLFILQGRDLAAASRVPTAAESEVGRPLANPMTATEPEIWAALAIRPIDEDAARARSEGWELARESLGAGRIVTAMIFVCVPLTYLLESFIPLLIGAPIIVGYALYRSARMLGSGGDLDKGYASTNRAIAPLGLEITERPQVSAGPRMPPAPGMKTYITGALRIGGSRHGRKVEIELAGGATEVDVAVRSPEFSARSSDGKLRNKKGLPPEIERALADVPASTGWKNLTASGDADGIHLRRSRSSEPREWLCDLWLAERLADSVGP